MCEKRARKIKKGSHITRLREARRLQRIQRMTPSPAVEDPNPGGFPQNMYVVDKAIQSKVILELAWKTVALMQKNKLIQQKIIALQKETSEFVASIINNQENKQRYMDYIRTQDAFLVQQNLSSPSSTSSNFTSESHTMDSVSSEWEPSAQNLEVDNKENLPLKTEPDF